MVPPRPEKSTRNGRTFSLLLAHYSRLLLLRALKLGARLL